MSKLGIARFSKPALILQRLWQVLREDTCDFCVAQGAQVELNNPCELGLGVGVRRQRPGHHPEHRLSGRFGTLVSRDSLGQQVPPGHRLRRRWQHNDRIQLLLLQHMIDNRPIDPRLSSY